MKFPGLTIKKLKAGIFDGPQIQKLMNDANFYNFVNPAELSAWTAFTNVENSSWEKQKHPTTKSLLKHYSQVSINWVQI